MPPRSDPSRNSRRRPRRGQYRMGIADRGQLRGTSRLDREDLSEGMRPDVDVVGGSVATPRPRRKSTLRRLCRIRSYGLSRAGPPDRTPMIAAASAGYRRSVCSDVAAWASAGAWEETITNDWPRRSALRRHTRRSRRAAPRAPTRAVLPATASSTRASMRGGEARGSAGYGA